MKDIDIKDVSVTVSGSENNIALVYAYLMDNIKEN